jgi:hypothetical protein
VKDFFAMVGFIVLATVGILAYKAFVSNGGSRTSANSVQSAFISSSLTCDETNFIFVDRDAVCVARFVKIDSSKVLSKIKANILADWYDDTKDGYEQIDTVTWNQFSEKGGYFDGRFNVVIKTTVHDDGILGLGAQEIPKDGTYRQVRVKPRYYYTDGSAGEGDEVVIPVKY